MRDIGRVSVRKQGYTKPYPHHCSAWGSSFPLHCTPNLLISPHRNHTTRLPSLLHRPSCNLQKVNDSSKYWILLVYNIIPSKCGPELVAYIFVQASNIVSPIRFNTAYKLLCTAKLT